MSHDRLMLRGESAGSFNLAVGEPVFLQESSWYTGHQLLVGPADSRYPAFGGDDQLIELIRKTNLNAKEHIVVTNGAKQAILAALYALKSGNMDPWAYFRPPYWPSYPTLLKLVGVSQASEREKGDLNIVTSPNNPDGGESIEDCDLWDAAYFHPVYRASAVPNCRISVWSIAKMYGLSGVRVGYATTSDAYLADKMREYIEITTSGVSNDSQKRVQKVLELQLESPNNMMAQYLKASQILAKNVEVFNFHLFNKLAEARGVAQWGGRGMFAWVKFPDAQKAATALAAANVKAIPGTACGETEPGWYRFSMGHRNSYTEQACEALSKALR